MAVFAPRNIPFPAPDTCRPSARERWRDISDLHSIKRSGAAAAANSQSPAAFRSQRYGQNHASPEPLPDQIPIDGKPFAASRGFVLRGLSDAGLCTGPSITPGRHPKPFTITGVDLLVVVRRQSTLKRPSSSYAAAGGDDRKRTLTSRAAGGKRSALERARTGCAARYTRMERSQACLSIR